MNTGISQREVLERELLSRPVSSLQHMLRSLAQVYPDLTELAVDGVFGEQTLEAVMRFQRKFGLPVTGVVDQSSWNAIRDRWLETEGENAESRAVRAFPSEGVRLEEGSDREYMILPQTMFQVLSRQFEGIVPDQADGFHGHASAQNAKWLQKAAGRPQTGVMDRATWDALSRLYEIFVVEELPDQPDHTGGWG